MELNVERYAGVEGESTEKFLHHAAVHSADTLVGEVRLKDQIGPAADIQGAACQGFIHRNGEVSVAADSPLVTQALPNRLAQHNTDVLYGVVAVHLQIPLAVQRQIQPAVNCQRRKHVV